MSFRRNRSVSGGPGGVMLPVYAVLILGGKILFVACEFIPGHISILSQRFHFILYRTAFYKIFLINSASDITSLNE